MLSDETTGLNPSNQETKEPTESSNPIVGQAGEGVRVVRNASQPTANGERTKLLCRQRQ